MQIHISKNEKKYVASSFLQDRNLYPELEQLEEKKKTQLFKSHERCIAENKALLRFHN